MYTVIASEYGAQSFSSGITVHDACPLSGSAGNHPDSIISAPTAKSPARKRHGQAGGERETAQGAPGGVWVSLRKLLADSLAPLAHLQPHRLLRRRKGVIQFSQVVGTEVDIERREVFRDALQIRGFWNYNRARLVQ